MSTFPLYYGVPVVLQAYSYGPGWLGATPGLPSDCVNDLVTIPDIFTQYLGRTTYSQGEPFYIMNSSGQAPAGQTQVLFNDVITLQQVSTGKFWTVVPKCHNDAGIALGVTGGATATYSIVPQSSSNANQGITAAVAGVAPSSTMANAFFLESTQQPKYYVYSDPNGNGVGLGSSTKTYFQFFLTKSPQPSGSCTTSPDSCPTGYSCVNNVCTQNAPPPTPCTSNSTCPSGYSCLNSVCQPPCTLTSQCTSPSLCTNGFCQPPQCTANSDCQANYVCQGNTCIPISACTTSSTCNQGWSCVNNICVPPAAQCSTTQKCSFGKSCVNGVCEFNWIIPAIAGGSFLFIIVLLIILSRFRKG